MKLNPALAKTLLMAAAIGMVVPVCSAQTPPNKNGAPAAPPPPGGAGAKPGTPSPEAPKEEVPEPVIPGMVIPRKGGGFLSLQVEGGRFKLSFYDAKKKLSAVDVVRATARWNPVNKAGDQRAVLNLAGDGQALVGTTHVRPPLVFKVYLGLIGADETTVESYVVDFRG